MIPIDSPVSFIECHGMEIVPTSCSLNCFYRSLSILVAGNENHWSWIRSIVTKFYTKHEVELRCQHEFKWHFEDYFPSNQCRINYLIFLAASNVFDKPIHIITSAHSKLFTFDYHDKNDRVSPTCDPIYYKSYYPQIILFTDRKHFSAVVPTINARRRYPYKPIIARQVVDLIHFEPFSSSLDNLTSLTSLDVIEDEVQRCKRKKSILGAISVLVAHQFKFCDPFEIFKTTQ
mmetsp:Transcript_4865/g.7198  ORF Transcript_4865/g.7198 Transcript_4865/m.7198 type:complete len:232 (+) Transcript_4865:91-786(+)